VSHLARRAPAGLTVWNSFATADRLAGSTARSHPRLPASTHATWARPTSAGSGPARGCQPQPDLVAGAEVRGKPPPMRAPQRLMSSNRTMYSLPLWRFRRRYRSVPTAVLARDQPALLHPRARSAHWHRQPEASPSGARQHGRAHHPRILGRVEHDLHQRRRPRRQVQAGVAEEEQRGVVFDMQVRSAAARAKKTTGAEAPLFLLASAPRRILEEVHTRAAERQLPGGGRVRYQRDFAGHASEDPCGA